MTVLGTTLLGDLRPEHELLLALARPALTADDQRQIRMFLAARATDMNWGEFIDQACRHMLMPLIGRHLSRLRLTHTEAGMPIVPCRWIYSDAYEGSRRRNAVLAEEYARVLRALNDAGLQYLIRKGPVLGEHFYHDLAARRISNLDVFTRRRDYPVLQQIATGLGYQMGELNANGSSIVPFDRKTELYWKVNLTNTSLPYARVGDRDLVESYLISTMFSLFQPMLGIRDDAEDFLNRSVDTMLYGEPSRMLHTADQILDSCLQIHLRATLFYYIESGKDLLIRNFLDLVHLLRHTTAECLSDFWERMVKFDCGKSVFYSLYFARQLYPGYVSQDMVDSCLPSDMAYLDEYGMFDGGRFTWKRNFAERLFDPRRSEEVVARSKVPGPRSVV